MSETPMDVESLIAYVSSAYTLPSAIKTESTTSTTTTRVPSHCRDTMNQSNNVSIFFVTAPKTRDHLPKIPPQYHDGDLVIVDYNDIYPDHVPFIKQSGYNVYAKVSLGALKHYSVKESPSLLGSMYGDDINTQWVRLATHRKLASHFDALYAHILAMGFEGVYLTDIDMITGVPENSGLEAELVQYIKMHYKKAYKHEMPLLMDVKPSLVGLGDVLARTYTYFCGFRFDHSSCVENSDCKVFAVLQPLLNKIVDRGCDIWHTNETSTC